MKWPKRLLKRFAGGLLMILFTGQVQGQPAVEDEPLVILQLQDAAPEHAELIATRVFTGNGGEGACAYYELLQEASLMAAGYGAELLKVISRAEHSRTHPCDRLEIAFYKTREARQAEQSFRWNASRPLDWDDFRGPVREGVRDNAVAETACGIAVETSLTGSRDQARVYVFNTFDKRQSWVREGFQRPEVLRHEQGHWNICQLYTLKMQAAFDAEHISGANLQQEVSRIYNEISRAYLARQDEYERETAHGTIASEQDRWSKMIDEELNAAGIGKL